MTSLKVGINEWVVLDLTANKPIKLWTSGLIGCVAVAIVTPTRAFVTHISSNIGADGWEETVKNEFSKEIGNIEDIDKAAECFVLGGDDPVLYGVISSSVIEIMKQKTKGACKVSSAQGSNNGTGVSAYWGSEGPCIQVIKGYKDEPPFKETLNSVTGAQYCKDRGVFSRADGSPADLGGD